MIILSDRLMFSGYRCMDIGVALMYIVLILCPLTLVVQDVIFVFSDFPVLSVSYILLRAHEPFLLLFCPLLFSSSLGAGWTGDRGGGLAEPWQSLGRARSDRWRDRQTIFS